MDARMRVEEAGSHLGTLRRAGRGSADEIMAAELALAEAQFEWAVEKALGKHSPTRETADRICKRLQSAVA